MHTCIDVHRLCCVDDRFVGLCIDAVDKNKFGIPTADSQAYNLKGNDALLETDKAKASVELFCTNDLQMSQAAMQALILEIEPIITGMGRGITNTELSSCMDYARSSYKL